MSPGQRSPAEPSPEDVFLRRVARLRDAGREVELWVRDDGTVAEVKIEYVGYGSRVLYRGALMIEAGRAYAEALRALEAQGFKDDGTAENPIELTIEIGESRDARRR